MNASNSNFSIEPNRSILRVTRSPLESRKFDTMNAPIVRCGCGLFLSLIGLAVVQAQPLVPVAKTPAPLGLLRLGNDAKPGQPDALAPSKFAVDDLAPNMTIGASRVKKDGVDVLTLDAGREWSRDLRGSPRAVSFVSFQINASQSTVVDIGGARLGLTASPIEGNLQLMFDDSATGSLQWKSLNFHVGTGRFAGKTLAALPTLTLRLDPNTSTWDLYSGGRLLADNLPMIAAKKDDPRFVLRAGIEGAWVTGLVMADENPLYEDANANGVDDMFESNPAARSFRAMQRSPSESFSHSTGGRPSSEKPHPRCTLSVYCLISHSSSRKSYAPMRARPLRPTKPSCPLSPICRSAAAFDSAISAAGIS
jgi:hypothetical protein